MALLKKKTAVTQRLASLAAKPEEINCLISSVKSHPTGTGAGILLRQQGGGGNHAGISAGEDGQRRTV